MQPINMAVTFLRNGDLCCRDDRRAGPLSSRYLLPNLWGPQLCNLHKLGPLPLCWREHGRIRLASATIGPDR